MESPAQKYSSIILSALDEIRSLEAQGAQGEDILAGLEQDAEHIQQVEDLKNAAVEVAGSGYFDELPFSSFPVDLLPKNGGFLKRKRVYPQLKMIAYAKDVIAPWKEDVPIIDLDTERRIPGVMIRRYHRAFLLADTGELQTVNFFQIVHIQKAVDKTLNAVREVGYKFLGEKEFLGASLRGMIKASKVGVDNIKTLEPVDLKMQDGTFLCDDLAASLSAGVHAVAQQKRDALGQKQKTLGGRT